MKIDTIRKSAHVTPILSVANLDAAFRYYTAYLHDFGTPSKTRAQERCLDR